MLRLVEWQMVAEVSEDRVVFIFRVLHS
jgi:hypothetical protein